jgi:RimJ/RimL family protein N-acetyltransferase
MLLPETIDTPRLRLRKPVIEDASGVYEAYGADPEVTRFLAWTPHQSLKDALYAMLSRLACWEAGTEFSWTITPQNEPGTIMGMISAVPDRKQWRCSLGYVLAKRHWNNGVMTEAVRAVIDMLFQQPGIYRVWAVVDEENFASARVLEKAGMEREGILHRWSLHPNVSAVPRDCWCFAVVR